MQHTAARLIEAAEDLAEEADALSLTSPKIHCIYNPLRYAWTAHRRYLEKYGEGKKRILLVGMNPGPWGMAQTGVPFGEVSFVRDWLGVKEEVGKPAGEHPKRPVHGFSCTKSEVSGRRLWGLMKERFGRAEDFFAEHFVENYCPLAFMEESGKNLTPDKLQKGDSEALFSLCDRHILRVSEILAPEAVIGIGKFAEKRLAFLQEHVPGLLIASILHPSPASPKANSGWAALATDQMKSLGLW
jgi:single-strand selective monofunctional uracil DNA glycosylase